VKRFAFVLFLVGMLLMAASCVPAPAAPAAPPSGADQPAAPTGVIKIGLQGPLTGDYAYEGKGFENAVKLLVEQTNAAGGINGQQVELIVEDDKGDPQESSLVADRMVSNKVAAVIGAYNSTATERPPPSTTREHPAHHPIFHRYPPDREGLQAVLPRLLPG
jgi:branched-chain amino acid transport system substrate-binding protein